MKPTRRLFVILLVLAMLLTNNGMTALAEAVLNMPAALQIIDEEAFYGSTSIDKVVLSDKVTEIRARAFANSTLSEINLPDSITFIADDAFDGPEKVTITANSNSYGYEWGLRNGYIEKNSYSDGSFEYTIENSECEITRYIGDSIVVHIPEYFHGAPVRSIAGGQFEGAFANCENIIEVQLPSTIRTIGKYAFKNCSQLQKINIPNGVQKIGSLAFDHCLNLKSITIPDSLKELETGVFECCYNLEEVTLSSGLERIGRSAFYICKSLKSVDIPYGVTSIGDRAFMQCYELEQISIPETVDEIGYQAFQSCYSLLDIAIPDDVQAIQRCAFYRCNNLRTIALPEGLRSIEEQAFDGCVSLKDISIPETVTEIGPSAFTDCKSLSEILIPEDLSCIRQGTFCNCTRLEHVYGGNSVTDIEDIAFKGCIKLKEYPFSEFLETIGIGAFEGCNSITHIELPESIVTIRAEAFIDCHNLNSVAFYGSPESIAEDIINSNSLESLYAFPGTTAYEWAVKHGYITMDDPFYSTVPSPATDFQYSIFRNECIIYYYKGNAVDVCVPEYIEGCPVTYLDEGAFQNKAELRSVVLPNTLKTIEPGLFYNCQNLRTVILPESIDKVVNSTFNMCTSLTTVTIPGTVKTIEAGAFAYCSSLKNVIIPCSVETIAAGAFEYCSGLEKIYIPNSVNEIQKAAFEGCSSLTSVNIPSGIDHIYKDTFKNCTSLKNITLPESMTEIDDSAFYGCSSLEGFVIPYGTTAIKENTFNNCSSLRSITIPGTVSCIGNSAFANCVSMSNIEIPDSVNEIGTMAFLGCSNLESVVIPNGVSVIGDRAFSQCSSLMSVSIPDTVQSIERWAFADCTKLINLVLPNSLSSIAKEAFVNCKSIISVKIPDGMQSLVNGVFEGCVNLSAAEVPQSVTSISSDTFKNCAALTIYGEVGSTAESYAVGRHIPFKSNLINTSDYVYYLENDSAIIVEYTGKNTSVSVPNSLDGHPVRGLDRGAFSNRYDITSVKLPLYLEYIGERAFENCCNMEWLRICRNLDSIEDFALAQCSNLSYVFIPESTVLNGDHIFDNHSSDFTIFGTDESDAQYYAEAHGIPFNVMKDGGYVLVGEIMSIDVLNLTVNIDTKTYRLENANMNGDLLALNNLSNLQDRRVICYIENGTVLKINRVSDVLELKLEPIGDIPVLSFENGYYHYRNMVDVDSIERRMKITLGIKDNDYYRVDDLLGIKELNDTVVIDSINFTEGMSGTLYDPIFAPLKTIVNISAIRGRTLRLGESVTANVSLSLDKRFVPEFVRTNMYIWLDCGYTFTSAGKSMQLSYQKPLSWIVRNLDYEAELKAQEEEAERLERALRDAKKKAMEKTASVKQHLKNPNVVIAHLNAELNEYLTKNQIDDVEDMLTVWVSAIIESTELPYLTDEKVFQALKKCFDITIVEEKLDWFGWIRKTNYNSKMEVNVKKGKKGSVKLVFHIKMDSFGYGKTKDPFSSLAQITMDITANGNTREGIIASMATYTDIRKLCDEMGNLAKQVVKDAYDESWGKHADVVADILFDKMVIDIINSKFGSFSNGVFTLMWH